MHRTICKSLCSILLLILMIVLPACNTTKGFGKDMEKAGEGLQNSADKHGAD